MRPRLKTGACRDALISIVAATGLALLVSCEARLTGSVPPVARAGFDQWLIVGSTAQLDGSGSSVATGQAPAPLTASWAIVAKPPESQAELSDASSMSPTFLVDEPGQYVLELVVSVGGAKSRPDVVVVYGYRPLQVVEVSPPNYAIDVNVTAPVVAAFSEPVQPESMRPDTFMILYGQDPWPGHLALTEGNAVAVFTPSTPYPLGALMAVVIGQQVVSLYGQPLPVAYHAQFMTASGPDLKAPVVLSLQPEDGSRDVVASTSVLVFVDEPITLASATSDGNGDGCPDAVQVVDSAGQCVAGTVVLAAAATRIILTPLALLLPGETYTTTVAAGTLSDLAGNTLARGAVASFTVTSEPDQTPPIVVSLYPGNGYTDVPLGAQVSATFSEGIAADSVSVASFTLANPQGLPVSGTFDLSVGNTVVTFTPDALETNTVYRLVVRGDGPTVIRDASGNGLDGDADGVAGGDLVISFHTTLLPTFDGVLTLPASVTPGTGILVSLSERDLDISSSLDTAAVQVTVSNGDAEAVLVLTETAAKSGVFEATIPTQYGTAGVVNDGLLSVAAGDVVTFEYQDAASEQGTPRQVSVEVPVVGGADGALSIDDLQRPGQPVSIRVDDPDENLSAATFDSLTVTVLSSRGETETVTLFETGNDTGAFVGQCVTSFGPGGVASDGVLVVEAGDTAEVTYVDQLTVTGSVRTDVATVTFFGGVDATAAWEETGLRIGDRVSIRVLDTDRVANVTPGPGNDTLTGTVESEIGDSVVVTLNEDVTEGLFIGRVNTQYGTTPTADGILQVEDAAILFSYHDMFAADGDPRGVVVTASLSVDHSNRAPVISNLPSTSAGRFNDLNSFDANAVDLDLPPNILTWSLFNNTCSFSETIDSASGLIGWRCGGGTETCSVAVMVTDNGTPALTDDEVLTIQCTNSNPPQVTSIPPAGSAEGAPYVYNIVCSDADGDPVTLSRGIADTCGGSVQDNTNGIGTYTFTPTETQGGGTCAMQVRCSDGLAANTQSTNLTVLEDNRPPYFTNATLIGRAPWGRLGTFQIYAADPDIPVDSLTFSLSNNLCSFTPTISPTTGVVSWSCDGVEGCAVDVTVTDDGTPPPALSTKTSLLIQCTNKAPTINSTPAATGTEGAAYSYNVSCIDQDGDVLTLAKGGSDTCGGTLNPIGNGTATYGFVPGENLGGGSCAIQITCSDTISPRTQFATVTIGEDNKPPVITNLPGTSSGRAAQSHSFSATAADPDIPAQGLTWSLGASSCGFVPTINPAAGVVSWTCGAALVTCTVPVTVTDNGSPLLSDTKTLTIVCGNTTPVLTWNPPTTATESILYSYGVVCTDADGDTLTLAKAGADNCPGSALANTGNGMATYTFTPDESRGGGSCTAAVTCTDTIATITSPSATVAIAEDNKAPVLTNLPATRFGNVGAANTFNATASDADIPIQILMWTLGVDTCSFNPGINSSGVVSWTCGATGETCTVPVTITDDGLPNRSDSKTLTIQCTGVPPPVITSTAPAAASEGAPYVYNITCTDPNSYPVTLAKGGADTCGGIVFDAGSGNGTYSVTPSETQGGASCVVQVTCSNGTTTATQSSSVLVSETNQAPVVANLPATKNGKWGAANSFTATATDADVTVPSQILSWSVPSKTCAFAVSVNGSSGVVSWTCGSAVVTCTADIRVADNGLPALSDTKTLTIVCTNTAPVLTWNPPTTATEGVLYSYGVVCTDADGDTLTLAKAGADNCPGSALANTGNGMATYTFTPDESRGGGSCTAAVTCTDTIATITSLSATVAIAEDNKAPVLSNLPASKSGKWGVANSYDVDATDADTPTQTLTYSLGSDDCTFLPTININSGVVSWLCGTTIETCTVPVTVTDSALPAKNASAVLTMSCTNNAPTFSTTAPAGATEGSLYMYNYTCADVDGDTLTVTRTAVTDTCGGTPTGGGTGTYTFTPTESQGGGSCVVALTCTDPVGGSATQSQNVSIAEDNKAPVLTNLPATKSGKWGAANSFTATATDADVTVPSQILSWSVPSKTCAFAVSVDSSGVVSWICGTSLVPCTADVKVTDNGSPILSDTDTLTIQCTNTAPAFTSSGSTSAVVGTPYTYYAVCFDANGDTLTLSVAGTDTCGGTLSGSGNGTRTYTFPPTAAQSGGTCVVALNCTDTIATATQSTTVAVTCSTNAQCASAGRICNTSSACVVPIANNSSGCNENGDCVSNHCCTTSSGVCGADYQVCRSGAFGYHCDGGSEGHADCATGEECSTCHICLDVLTDAGVGLKYYFKNELVDPESAENIYDEVTGDQAGGSTEVTITGSGKIGDGYMVNRYGSFHAWIENAQLYAVSGPSFTASEWIYLTAYPPADEDDFILGTSADHTPWSSVTGYVSRSNGSGSAHKLGFNIFNTSGQGYSVVGSTVLSLNTWYHVAFVYESSTKQMRIFLNGVNDTPTPGQFVGAFYPSNGGENYGAKYWGSGVGMVGTIDEVSMHTIALSPSQITSLYNCGNGRSYPYQLVTNGHFDTASNWVPQASTTIASGEAIINNPSSNNTAMIYQTIPIVQSRRYRVEFDVASYVSGTLRWRFGSMSDVTANNIDHAANGHYSEDLTIATTPVSPRITFYTGSSGAVMHLDNVSVVEVARAPGVAMAQQIVNSAASTTSLTATLPAATTIGNLLVVVGAISSGSLTSVDGGGVDAWTLATESTTNANIEVWYGMVAVPSTTGVTIATGAVSGARMSVSEWSGLVGTVDIAASQAKPTSPSPASAPTITTTNAKDLIIFGVDNGSPNTFGSPGGSWVAMTATPSVGSGEQSSWYQTVSSTGSFSPSVTETRHAWDAAIVAFKILP